MPGRVKHHSDHPHATKHCPQPPILPQHDRRESESQNLPLKEPVQKPVPPHDGPHRDWTGPHRHEWTDPILPRDLHRPNEHSSLSGGHPLYRDPILPRQAPTPPTTSTTGTRPLLPTSINADLRSQVINKQTLPWLIVVIVLAVTSLTFVSFLLCRCCRRRSKKGKQRLNTAGHAYHSSLDPTDGRNKHWQWNRSLPKPAPIGLGITGAGLEGSEISMTPLATAAVRPAGYGHLGPGVSVVDEEPVSPLTTPASVRRPQQKGSRYYSGLSNAWKRVSQIGRAL